MFADFVFAKILKTKVLHFLENETKNTKPETTQIKSGTTKTCSKCSNFNMNGIELKLFENEYIANFSFRIFHATNICKNSKSYKNHKI